MPDIVYERAVADRVTRYMDELQADVERLRAEIARLKALLDAAGISHEIHGNTIEEDGE